MKKHLAQTPCVIFFFFYIVESQINYNDKKWINVLTENNFNSLVKESDRFWIVEYYLEWCGACAVFSPVFSSWAWELKRWGPVLEVGAVACNDYSSLCSSEHIHNVPVIKFYYGKIEKTSKSLVTGSQEIELLRKVLLDQLQTDLEKFKGKNPQWPVLNDIDPRESNVTGDFMFLIIEDERARDGNLGRLVIMDNVMLLPDVSVFRSPSLLNLQPGLYQYFDTNSTFINTKTEYSRDGMNAAILRITRRKISGGPGDKNDFNIPVVKVDDVSYVYKPPTSLYMQDLTLGIFHMLNSDVASLPSIDAEAHQALLDYLIIMHKYHIVDLNSMEYLHSLIVWLNKTDPPITTSAWNKALQDSESNVAYLPHNIDWKACKGSAKHYRGYPCSVWMTIHTLIISAHNNPRGANVDRIGLKILLAFRSYIHHFFRCIECRENFVKYSKDWLTEPEDAKWTAKKATLDIWRRHNLVNLNLHKISPLTEDPEFPKIQFPSIIDCPECRKVNKNDFSVFVSNISDWNQDEVFEYLVKYYSQTKSQSCAEIGKPVVTSPWSPCSKTCGVGISTRMANNNEDCKLGIESQICMDRPCSFKFPAWTQSLQRRNQCIQRGHTYELSRSSTLNFSMCTTLLKHKWNICGICPPRHPRGRPVCCVPKIFTTKSYKVLCSNLTVSKERKDEKEDAIWLNEKLDLVRRERASFSVSDVDVRVIKLCECNEKYC